MGSDRRTGFDALKQVLNRAAHTTQRLKPPCDANICIFIDHRLIFGQRDSRQRHVERGVKCCGFPGPQEIENGQTFVELLSTVLQVRIFAESGEFGGHAAEASAEDDTAASPCFLDVAGLARADSDVR